MVKKEVEISQEFVATEDDYIHYLMTGMAQGVTDVLSRWPEVLSLWQSQVQDVMARHDELELPGNVWDHNFDQDSYRDWARQPRVPKRRLFRFPNPTEQPRANWRFPIQRLYLNYAGSVPVDVNELDSLGAEKTILAVLNPGIITRFSMRTDRLSLQIPALSGNVWFYHAPVFQVWKNRLKPNPNSYYVKVEGVVVRALDDQTEEALEQHKIRVKKSAQNARKLLRLWVKYPLEGGAWGQGKKS